VKIASDFVFPSSGMEDRITPQMIDKLKANQPPISVFEWIVIFIGADIPLFVGQGIGTNLFGLPYWPAFVVGLILMAVCMLGHFAIRRIVLSD
jgi:hypothetical protein